VKSTGKVGKENEGTGKNGKNVAYKEIQSFTGRSAGNAKNKFFYIEPANLNIIFWIGLNNFSQEIR
jgi:hypothetical protein